MVSESGALGGNGETGAQGCFGARVERFHKALSSGDGATGEQPGPGCAGGLVSERQFFARLLLRRRIALPSLHSARAAVRARCQSPVAHEWRVPLTLRPITRSAIPPTALRYG